jgi:hypothetical protein
MLAKIAVVSLAVRHRNLPVKIYFCHVSSVEPHLSRIGVDNKPFVT